MSLDATRRTSTGATRSTITVRVFHRHHCRRSAGCAAARDNNCMVRWCGSASIMILYYHGRAIPWLVRITGSGSGGGATFSSVSDPRNGRGHHHHPRLLLKGRRNEYNGRWCPVVGVARGNIRLRRRAPARLIYVRAALLALWFVLKARDVRYHWMMSVIPWRDYRSKPRSCSTRSTRITTLRVGDNRRNHWLRHAHTLGLRHTRNLWLRHTNHILGHEPRRIFSVRHSRATLRAGDNWRND
jgi:hypothetical protein